MCISYTLDILLNVLLFTKTLLNKYYHHHCTHEVTEAQRINYLSWGQPLSGLSTRVLSHFTGVQLFATLWTVALQAPLFTGFSRQEHWSGLPCPPPGDLPGPGIKPESLMSPALAGGFFTTVGKPTKWQRHYYISYLPFYLDWNTLW